MSYSLIDSVRVLVDGERIVAVKSLNPSESFFRGHFPGNPVMPGVLICDALAQAAELLVRRSYPSIGPDRALELTALDGARFRRPVTPGDELELEVFLVGSGPRRWPARGVGRVAGSLVAEMDLVLEERERIRD